MNAIIEMEVSYIELDMEFKIRSFLVESLSCNSEKSNINNNQ